MTNCNSPERNKTDSAFERLYSDLNRQLVTKGQAQIVLTRELDPHGTPAAPHREQTYIERTLTPVDLGSGWRLHIRRIPGDSEEAFNVNCNVGLAPAGQRPNILQLDFWRDGGKDKEFPYETIYLTRFAAAKNYHLVDEIEIELLSEELGFNQPAE